ncbi:MAG: ribosome recycling factor [Candidatus Nomurabacteria bacterium]|jgi:ribosome recycling factor|nr:ribosome recycling factor [Candidatus Nomurabacteria bacterium]
MFDTKPYEEKFAAVAARLEGELKKVRTGRAHPDMLAGVTVEAYGQKMPLKNLASISAPEPQQLLITPFDPSTLQNIAAAIRADSTLGFNPSDDGRNVRVPVPPLTEERRREIVKSLNEKVEQAKIAARAVREDARKAARVAKEAKQIGEDDLKRIDKGIDDDMAKLGEKLDALAKAKADAVMTL